MAGRPKGAKGADYDDKRRELIARVRSACFAEPARQLSFREMAAAADASVPTLKHYFGDRDGLVSAILEQAWKDAAGLLQPRFDADEPLAERIASELSLFRLGVTQFGLDRLHVWGMNEGLSSPMAGPAYLNYFLEPTLQAAEHWLQGYQDIGKIPAAISIRHAAITLFAPCLIFVMHQDYLGGREVREGDLRKFLEDHATGFLAYLGATQTR